MPDPYALYVYAIAWAAGAALLAFLMHVGKLPAAKTGLAVRVLMAAVVSAMLVAAVYGAQHLDRRAQALQRRRHEAARGNLASAKRATGTPATSRAGAAGPQVPRTRARIMPPSQRSAAARSSLLGTMQHGARNAAALMRGTRAGAGPAPIPIDQQEQEQEQEEEVPPAPTEADLDAEHDRAQSMKTAGTGMVGEVREAAFSARIRPRRTEAAEQWLGPETPSARKLAEILTFDGMREHSDTTLFAREAYKTHQWNEPGEGMDQRYVDPSLTSYDPAFTAYSEQPFVDQRSTLSTRAPAAF